jgi:hypothetical protein
VARRSLFDDPGDGLDLDPWEGASTAFRGVIEERTQQKVRTRTRRLSFAEWLPLVPEVRGPLDLDRFPFQRELYEQHAVDDEEQVSKKATQIGESTRAIRIALYQADVEQRGVLYTFPTDEELSDFSRKRIKPVIRASRHLMSRMTGDGVDNVGQKQIGTNGWIFFRGTMKPIDSLDVDVLVADEFDTSDQANLAASIYRVTGLVSAGLLRWLGVPSIPGYGISDKYEGTDQRTWTVKCWACGEWNPIGGFETYQANVDEENVRLVCRRGECRRDLDVKRGEWVARYPDRGVRGYHIPKLVVPSRKTLAGVIANSRKTKDYEKTHFFNRDLGEPYAPAEGRLSLEQVQACVRGELRPVDPWGMVPASHRLRTAGIDVASKRALNVVIEEEVDYETSTGVKLWVGEIEDDPARGPAIDQLGQLMVRFGVHMAAIDDSPDGRMSQAFAERFPGRVYRVSFFTPGPAQKQAPSPMNVDDAEMFVGLWRTRAYDATFERFRMQRVLLPPLESLPRDYPAHLGNLYRQKTEVERKGQDGRKVATGVVRVDYLKTGPEDYGQAEAYNLAAIELFYRRVGLGLALGQGPVPLAELDGAAGPDEEDEVDALDLIMGGQAPAYRSGFE